jgi:hypothetical protein
MDCRIVLVRAARESDDGTVLDISLTGFLFHHTGDTALVATPADPLVGHYQTQGEAVALSERLLCTAKADCHLHVRLNIHAGCWMRARVAAVVQHPKETARLDTVLKRAEWKRMLTDLLILECQLSGCRIPALPEIACAPAKAGMPLLLLAAPFGIFCPDAFANTISSGVVSTLIPDSDLFLSDVRGLPGAAGGLVIVRSEGRDDLVGVLLGDLKRISNQSIEINLCINASFLLESFSLYLRWMAGAGFSLPSAVHHTSDVPSALQQAVPSVVLICCGPRWASGVVVDR